MKLILRNYFLLFQETNTDDVKTSAVLIGILLFPIAILVTILMALLYPITSWLNE